MANGKITYSNVANPNSVNSNFVHLNTNGLPKRRHPPKLNNVNNTNTKSEEPKEYSHFGGSHPLGPQHKQWLKENTPNLNGVNNVLGRGTTVGNFKY